MSQKFSLYDDLSVIQNIDFFAGIYRLPRAKRQEREDWVIEMAGLHDHRNELTASLSAGWKQRLALGCAVLHEPPVLFLDEPTSGVDPMSRRQFWELIYELAGRGVTVFVTTHYMDEAEYCDRLALIYRGKIVALGTPSALKAEHMSDQVIEVLCQRPQDALDTVAALPGVREVALYGRGLHVVAADAAALIPALTAALTQAGSTPERVEQIVPGLEDVFVSLIEEHDREQAAVKEVCA